jgi:hypothetical protein
MRFAKTPLTRAPPEAPDFERLTAKRAGLDHADLDRNLARQLGG